MGIAPGAADGIRRSRGCAACGFTGTPGRRPLFEVLEPSAAVRRQIVEGRDGDLREAALGSGFVPLLHQARDRVVRGEVGLGEAYRHCYFGQEE
jgi:type II secretory ATPase GspE/PulE/Tfp pilus assembly ATPase PilB-like protein